MNSGFNWELRIRWKMTPNTNLRPPCIHVHSYTHLHTCIHSHTRVPTQEHAYTHSTHIHMKRKTTLESKTSLPIIYIWARTTQNHSVWSSKYPVSPKVFTPIYVTYNVCLVALGFSTSCETHKLLFLFSKPENSQLLWYSTSVTIFTLDIWSTLSDTPTAWLNLSLSGTSPMSYNIFTFF